MKYIETFENILSKWSKNIPDKSESDDQYYLNMFNEYRNDQESSKKFEKLIPGNYIIYEDPIQDWKYKNLKEQYIDHLILCRIEQNWRDDKYVYRKNPGFYTNVKYIDFISKGKELLNKNEMSSAQPVDEISNKIIYSTKSLVDAKNKFEELKNQKPYENWIMNDNMKKYNL